MNPYDDQPNSDDSGNQPNENPENGPVPAGDGGQFTQRVKHQQISARVPEDIAKGVFASAALVLNGPHEFIVDFIQTVARPHQVVSRVILPISIMPSMLNAMKQNLDNYQKRFGPPPELPKPSPGTKPPTIEEIYDQLKLPDETSHGSYCNTVMITHSPSEFCFDFITSFYPRSTVAQRVYMSTPQVLRLNETLVRSFEQFQNKMQARRDQMRQQGMDGGAPFSPPPITDLPADGQGSLDHLPPAPESDFGGQGSGGNGSAGDTSEGLPGDDTGDFPLDEDNDPRPPGAGDDPVV